MTTETKILPLVGASIDPISLEELVDRKYIVERGYATASEDYNHISINIVKFMADVLRGHDDN